MRFNPYGYWYDQPIVVVDFETTGTDESTDRAVEIGIARFEDRKVVATWDSLLYPEREVPDEAAAIHGITTARVATAPPFVVAIPRMLELGRDAQPCAYNASFDRRFWGRELELTAVRDLERHVPAFDPDVPWLDPLVWIRHFDRFKKGQTNKLTDACQRHGVTLDGAHRASADAVAAGSLLYVLVDHIGHVTMSELLRQQMIIGAAQETRTQAWLARKARGE